MMNKRVGYSVLNLVGVLMLSGALTYLDTGKLAWTIWGISLGLAMSSTMIVIARSRS